MPMTAISEIACVREQVPLAERTWFKLGGAAQFFAEPTSVDELVAVVARCRAEQMPIRLLGSGSNVLVREAGVTGMVISLAAPCFARIDVAGCTVTAGGGAQLANVITTAGAPGLAGLAPPV